MNADRKVDRIRRRNPQPTDPTAYDLWFDKYEAMYNLPPGLLKSIAWVESRYRSDADAGKNRGKGLMQFVQSTAREYGIDPFKPEEAIHGAARYMSNALKAAKGNIQEAVQMYNMGIDGGRRFMRHGDKSVAGDPDYYKKVMATVEQITNHRAVSPRKPGTPAPTWTPANADEAKQFINISEAVQAASADPSMLSPKQAGWADEIDEMAMLAKLNDLFDIINAEHESMARTGRHELESLLSDTTEGIA